MSDEPSLLPPDWVHFAEDFTKQLATAFKRYAPPQRPISKWSRRRIRVNNWIYDRREALARRAFRVIAGFEVPEEDW
jgi:hypothetical protein